MNNSRQPIRRVVTEGDVCDHPYIRFVPTDGGR